MKPDSAETCALLDNIRQGDRQALGALLERHRPAIRAFVELHLDPRVRARLDPSDVIQETQVELMRRIEDFLEQRPMPFRLWLRKKAYERILNLQRAHLQSARRSVTREVAWPDRSSLLLARPLLSGASSPSKRLERRELQERLGRAVAGLAAADRSILLLRHAEEMPFDDIACLLGVEPAAARKRFGRALIRLQKALVDEGLLESQS